MCKTDAGRAKIQAAIDNYFPYLPAFFGRAKSRNNARYRHWGIKQRSNEEMPRRLRRARPRAGRGPFEAQAATGSRSRVSLEPVVGFERRATAVAWFAAVGAPLAPDARADAVAWLRALGRTDVALEPGRRLARAKALADAPGWDQAWWVRRGAPAHRAARRGDGAPRPRAAVRCLDPGHPGGIRPGPRAGAPEPCAGRPRRPPGWRAPPPGRRPRRPTWARSRSRPTSRRPTLLPPSSACSTPGAGRSAS